jgi:hypothetical protein
MSFYANAFLLAARLLLFLAVVCRKHILFSDRRVLSPLCGKFVLNA